MAVALMPLRHSHAARSGNIVPVVTVTTAGRHYDPRRHTRRDDRQAVKTEMTRPTQKEDERATLLELLLALRAKLEKLPCGRRGAQILRFGYPAE